MIKEIIKEIIKKNSTWIRRVCSVLLIFATGCGLIYVMQDSMMFHNVNDQGSRKFLQNMSGYSDVMFTAGNGKTYHGMMHQTSNEKSPLVIYFGGNGEVSYRNLRMHDALNQWRYFAGYNYLFVDYEGYGLNDGRPHYLNMYEHSIAVFDYAASLQNIDSSRIVVMGYSLGTGSAVYLAANRLVAGLILIAPFANGYDLYNNILPIFAGPMRLLVKQKFPSDKYAPHVICPTLIIASRNDELIPFSSSQRLSKLFSDNVDFMALDNVRHNYIFQIRGVFSRVQSFLEEVAAGKM